jgi:hypothetical protein
VYDATVCHLNAASISFRGDRTPFLVREHRAISYSRVSASAHWLTPAYCAGL